MSNFFAHDFDRNKRKKFKLNAMSSNIDENFWEKIKFDLATNVPFHIKNSLTLVYCEI